MESVVKRNIVLKEVITPTLKQAGFKKSGLRWRKDCMDCCLLVKMNNLRWNGTVTGFTLWFEFNACR